MLAIINKNNGVVSAVLWTSGTPDSIIYLSYSYPIKRKRKSTIIAPGSVTPNH